MHKRFYKKNCGDDYSDITSWTQLILPRQGVSINSLAMRDIDLCYWLASGRILTTFSISVRQVPPSGCLTDPIFSNLRSYAACWVHIMCHHELWPTSASHPFSSLSSSLCLAGRNRLLSLYSFLSLAFVLTFFCLFYNCSLGLYFSPGNQWKS